MSGGEYRYSRWGVVVLALVLAAFLIWNMVVRWAPSRDNYPVQGVVVSAANGSPEWARLGATGVDFAYLTASEGATGRDARFTENVEAVQQAGIRFGALHHYDICKLAADQAAQFITTVPRDERALPAAIQLDFSDNCTSRPNRAFILSEIATFLSQIEAHSGTPAILLLSQDFEEAYRVSGAVDRTIWTEGYWAQPDYTARPWVMWTANPARRIEGVDGPVRWVVVRR